MPVPVYTGYTQVVGGASSAPPSQPAQANRPSGSGSEECHACGERFETRRQMWRHITKKRHQRATATPAARPAATLEIGKHNQEVKKPKLITADFYSFMPVIADGSRGLRLSNNQWSVVPKSQWLDFSRKLGGLCHSVRMLKEARYITREWSIPDISAYRKCKSCKVYRGDRECHEHHDHSYNFVPCHFPSAGSLCKQMLTHEFQSIEKTAVYRLIDHRQTPHSLKGSRNPRPALAIDCEMVEVTGKRSEVARLSVVDFLTGDELINKYVRPDGKVTNWRSWVSGVDENTFKKTPKDEILDGWESARAELWKYMDEDTILVGHALNYDLDALRMVHHSVVDSAILAQKAISLGCKKSVGLKNLCQSLLGKEIQATTLGHSALEDALATWEVVLCILQHPNSLQEWASQQ